MSEKFYLYVISHWHGAIQSQTLTQTLMCFPGPQLYEDPESPSAGGTTQGSRHSGYVSPQEFCHRDFGRQIHSPNILILHLFTWPIQNQLMLDSRLALFRYCVNDESVSGHPQCYRRVPTQSCVPASAEEKAGSRLSGGGGALS